MERAPGIVVVTEARDPSADFSLRSRPARIPRAFRRDARAHHVGGKPNFLRDSAGLSGIPRDRRRPSWITLMTTMPLQPAAAQATSARCSCLRLPRAVRLFLRCMARSWRNPPALCSAGLFRVTGSGEFEGPISSLPPILTASPLQKHYDAIKLVLQIGPTVLR